MSYLVLLFLFITQTNSCQWSSKQCGCARISPSIHHRIVGGKPATPHSWPWIVSVRKNDGHICGGVLITDRYVLTAAHCFKSYYPGMLSYYSFAIGHHGLREKNLVLKAKRIVLHKSFDTNGRLINDIALVELDQRINFENDRLGFICLPWKHINDNVAFPSIGTQTWVVGWGAKQNEGPAAEELMQVSVPITNNEGCRKRVTAPTKQVCAGYDHGGKDSCQGDSGGPLVVETGNGVFELIGIVSFGVKCATYMEPGIYTRVSAYIDWIQELAPEIKQEITQNTSNHLAELPQALTSANQDYQKISSFMLFITILLLI